MYSARVHGHVRMVACTLCIVWRRLCTTPSLCLCFLSLLPSQRTPLLLGSSTFVLPAQ